MRQVHSLLRRQLRRHFGDQFAVPPEWKEFVSAVNDAYSESDTDRNMLERSLELSSQELIQANSELRALFKAIPDLMFRLDGDGTILAYEAGDMAHFYMQPERLVGRRIQDVPPPSLGDKFRKAIEQVRDTKSIVSIEYWMRIQNRDRCYEARHLPLLEDQIIAIIRDVTEQKRAQEGLRESEGRLRLAWETSPDAFSISRLRDGIYVDVNKGYSDLTGYSREEVLGASALDIPIWCDPAAREPLVSGLMQTGHVRNLKTQFRLKNGEIRPVLISAGLMTLLGEPHLLAITKDITELHRAQEALALSEEKYRALFENAGDAILMVGLDGDEAGRIVSANRVAAAMHGYGLDELLGLGIADLDALEEIPHLPQRIDSVINGQWIKDEILHRRKDGTSFPVEVTAGPLRVKEHTYLLAIYRDISERKKAEEKLRASELKYRNILETIADGYHEIDLAGNLTLVNDSLCEIIGYHREELLRMNYRQLMDEENLNRTFAIYGEVFRTGVSIPECNIEIRRKDGTMRYVSVSISPMKESTGRSAGFRGILRDVTERRHLEEQLRQAAKMEAIGRMAGGIAHDFNNLLTAIMGYSTILSGQLREEGIDTGKLQQIHRSAERAAELTRQLLAFSRRQLLEMKVVNPNDLIRDMASMLRRLIGEDIELLAVLDPEAGNVKADPAQLGQIIMNLSVNARDAMPKGGKLTLETTNAFLDEAYARTHAEVTTGRYVMLSVSDTGFGMDSQTCSRAFDPFFTTKEKGVGTGLGLSTVYGIVKQHEGHIKIYSEVGTGTTFKIYLPLAHEPLPAAPVQTEIERTPTGTETIMLVEDEDAVRLLAVEALEMLGYQVLSACSPAEALAIGSEHRGQIHLLLSDVVLPQMDGRSLYEIMRQQRAEMKALFVSGYTENFIVHHGMLDPGVSFLPKPFSVDGLARRVRQVLDQ